MKLLLELVLGTLLLGNLLANDDQSVVLNARQIGDALDVVGSPLSENDKEQLDRARTAEDVSAILDSKCIVEIVINPESRVKVGNLSAIANLVEKGWSSHLIKVVNEAGVTAPLQVTSEQALPLANAAKESLADRWLKLDIFRGRPLAKTLSGASLEYRILQLYSRDSGKRSAKLKFDVGQGTQDLGFRSEILINFNCEASADMIFEVLDENNESTIAAFEIRDMLGRIYPDQAKRVAPDMHFHPQIYRGSGETVRLPKGEYVIGYSRGPEYFAGERKFICDGKGGKLSFKLERWIDPSKHGWWSGDHHIHAAGCAHYTKPTEGVHASDMMRHCIGEDLKIGANLTWGPCFDYQKQFFTGKDDKVSKYPYLLRYDVEVSGFGSHQSGHLCLLRLKKQMYPGGKSKHHWPTLGLNTLRWAKAQGALVGPAHSGWGLRCESKDLPNYEIPPFDSIGANEYIVDVTHKVPGPEGNLVPAVDFLSTVDTPIVWELNIWYHTLNVGYRTRISGETDFPCIYGERVGLGRSYVKMDGKLNYENWCEGIRSGRNYTGDGRSHLMDFTVSGIEAGTKGSEISIDRAGPVKASVRAAALLSKEPNKKFKGLPYTAKPYWHIERARVGEDRKVKVELLVNGYPVKEVEMVADGKINDIEFNVNIDRSSWLAVRVLGSSHSNPFWVLVDDKPVRASKRSALWCLKSVEKCWGQKERFISKKELDDAKFAYEHARNEYKKRVEECVFE
ncbi:MAG: CehA/McbA family metallohydrolase [Verrucomicrobiota bacterium]|nr:CehA/McbA family metallohydrolase [Verrucomicrobiota bacterium]